MKALITGITGQDGAYLAEYLLSKDYEVFGLVRARNNDFWRLDELNIKDKISYIQGDLLEFTSLLVALMKSKPQEVYNLASQSSVGYSWEVPMYTAQVTGIGCLNMLEAVKQWNKDIKFYQASSSEMYGNNHSELNIKLFPNNWTPNNPYAIAKLFAYHTTINYRESYGMFCCNGIAFNHESPLRGMQFVTRKITDGVAKIKLGFQSSLKLGNTTVKRDFGFAGDYVKAMHLILQQETHDDFIIATGVSVAIEDFCRYAFNYVKLNHRQYVVTDPELYRPNEIDNLVGNYDKIRALGWEPTVHVKELAEMMVEADLQRLGSNSSVGLRKDVTCLQVATNQRHWKIDNIELKQL